MITMYNAADKCSFTIHDTGHIIFLDVVKTCYTVHENMFYSICGDISNQTRHTLAFGQCKTGFWNYFCLWCECVHVSIHPKGIYVCEWIGPCMTSWTSSNIFSKVTLQLYTYWINIMMGMALVMKHVVGNLFKKATTRLYKLLISYRRYFNSCTLVTRWSASILVPVRVERYWYFTDSTVSSCNIAVWLNHCGMCELS